MPKVYKNEVLRKQENETSKLFNTNFFGKDSGRKCPFIREIRQKKKRLRRKD